MTTHHSPEPKNEPELLPCPDPIYNAALNEAFKKHMDGRHYGEEETADAFEHFKGGFDETWNRRASAPRGVDREKAVIDFLEKRLAELNAGCEIKIKPGSMVHDAIKAVLSSFDLPAQDSVGDKWEKLKEWITEVVLTQRGIDPTSAALDAWEAVANKMASLEGTAETGEKPLQ